MADKAEPRDKDREAELKRQQAVRDAIDKATRGKDGEPVPIVVPRLPQEG